MEDCTKEPKKLVNLEIADTPGNTDYIILVQGGKAKKLLYPNLVSGGGTIIYSEVGAPDNDNGNNNDYYINETNFEFFKKETGLWISKGLLKGSDGADGADGVDGDNGTNGANGSSLSFNWSGTELGVRVGNSGAYTYVDLKGDTGATGATGASGSNGTNGVGLDIHDLMMKLESTPPNPVIWQELTGGTVPVVGDMPAPPVGWKWYKKII